LRRSSSAPTCKTLINGLNRTIKIILAAYRDTAGISSLDPGTQLRAQPTLPQTDNDRPTAHARPRHRSPRPRLHCLSTVPAAVPPTEARMPDQDSAQTSQAEPSVQELKRPPTSHSRKTPPSATTALPKPPTTSLSEHQQAPPTSLSLSLSRYTSLTLPAGAKPQMRSAWLTGPGNWGSRPSGGWTGVEGVQWMGEKGGQRSALRPEVGFVVAESAVWKGRDERCGVDGAEGRGSIFLCELDLIRIGPRISPNDDKNVLRVCDDVLCPALWTKLPSG